MEVLFFLKQRTNLIAHFYEEASSVFAETQRKIREGEAPYEPPYSESGEPSFLTEYLRADIELDLLGRAAISLLSDTIKTYFKHWTDLLWVSNNTCKEAFPAAFAENGFVHGYIFCLSSATGLKPEDCPADVAILEQVVLARNLVGHAGDLASDVIDHDPKTVKKYPKLFFVSENSPYTMRSFGGDENPFGFQPALYVSEQGLRHAIAQVDALAEWLEEPLQKYRYGH